MIELAVINALGEGNLNEKGLQEELDKLADKEEKVDVSTAGNRFEIYFEGQKGYHEVDEEGNVGDYNIVQEITNPGDITKDETLDGSKEMPYEISCIEDLVDLSNKFNNTSERWKYANKNFVLTRNLNFKSKFSYHDSNRTNYGDINEDGNVDALMKELTTEKGFIPITGFSSNFDGQGYEISNLYEKNRGDTSLFGYIESASVKNLGLTGTLESTGRVGGFAADDGSGGNIIENCYFKGSIKAGDIAGGIIGDGCYTTISNCFTKGNIVSNTRAGGILGFTRSELEIKNCYNMSTINGIKYAGGIVGETNGVPKVYNSFNIGKIKSDKQAGGIVGNIYAAMKIKNVYNIGKVECSSNAGGIVGGALWNSPDILIENSFYLEGTATKGTITVTDTTTAYSSEIMKSESFVKELNEYIDNNSDITAGWLKWKIGEKGYPVFE